MIAIAEQVDGRKLQKGLAWNVDMPPVSQSDFVADALTPDWPLMDQGPQTDRIP